MGWRRIRDLNDEINKLIREKGHWEVRIVELGGPDYAKSAPRAQDSEGNEIRGATGKGAGYRRVHTCRPRHRSSARSCWASKHKYSVRAEGACACSCSAGCGHSVSPVLAVPRPAEHKCMLFGQRLQAAGLWRTGCGHGSCLEWLHQHAMDMCPWQPRAPALGAPAPAAQAAVSCVPDGLGPDCKLRKGVPVILGVTQPMSARQGFLDTPCSSSPDQPHAAQVFWGGQAAAGRAGAV